LDVPDVHSTRQSCCFRALRRLPGNRTIARATPPSCAPRSPLVVEPWRTVMTASRRCTRSHKTCSGVTWPCSFALLDAGAFPRLHPDAYTGVQVKSVEARQTAKTMHTFSLFCPGGLSAEEYTLSVGVVAKLTSMHGCGVASCKWCYYEQYSTSIVMPRPEQQQRMDVHRVTETLQRCPRQATEDQSRVAYRCLCCPRFDLSELPHWSRLPASRQPALLARPPSALHSASCSRFSMGNGAASMFRSRTRRNVS
jgi:hypothetical protein